jgi:Spy/CpxP family protein refolding chaperone
MKGNTLKFILIISLVLNISFIGSYGYSIYREHQPQPEPGFTCDFQKGNMYPFQELSLNKEQLKAFREKAFPFHAAIYQKRHEIVQKRSALFALIRSEKPDSKAIDMSISEINKLQEDMQKIIVGHLLEMKAMLEKDQQKKFLDLIEKNMTDPIGMPCR